MVSKLPDGRGQVAIKGHSVNDEWERLVKGAARQNGQTFADFITTHTTAAAQAILKGEPATPAALPMRLEDVAASLTDRLTAEVDRLRTDQAAETARLRAEQAAGMEALARQARRGRWRR